MSGGPDGRIVICAKSAWTPSIRREHALAIEAVRHGQPVEFFERARDLRALRAPRRAADQASWQGVQVSRRYTLVPGHRNRLAHALDGSGLSRRLRRAAAPAAVVVNAPWNWAGVEKVPADCRLIFDLADDWRVLMPHRRESITRQYHRIADGADAIIVASAALAAVFDRPTVLVPNATSGRLLAAPVTEPPRRHRMVYVGTLSERFDARLMQEVLTRLPEWSLDLYGPCQYAGRGRRPDRALTGLLGVPGSRARWHGPVAAAELAGVLNGADVLVLPNDPAISGGQDSMKLYDYATRGRPMVSTPLPLVDGGPPGLVQVDGPAAFVLAVQQAYAGGGGDGSASRSWAAGHSWSERIRPWLRAVRGEAADRPRVTG